MGGKEKGEIASQSIVDSIACQYEKLNGQNIEEDTLKKILKNAIHELTLKTLNDSSLFGASTTLALLYLLEKEAIVAHIGDSRVIHLMNHQYWATKDHSMVQELFEGGILKSEEAMQKHPLNNRITRAISAGTDNSDQIEIQRIQLSTNDNLFLICSDGLLEHYTNLSLASLFLEKGINQAWETIDQKCKNESRDNSTVILTKR